jgi:hypothetical protein
MYFSPILSRGFRAVSERKHAELPLGVSLHQSHVESCSLLHRVFDPLMVELTWNLTGQRGASSISESMTFRPMNARRIGAVQD